MNRRALLQWPLALAAACLAQSAFAQVIQPPPRRPVPGETATQANRVQQDMRLDTSLMVGYDRGGVSLLSLPAAALVRPVGYTGFGDATLTYAIANGTRGLNLVGHAYGSAEPGQRLPNTYYYGGDLIASAQTDLGRRSGLSVSQSIGYRPYQSLGTFGTPQGIPSPDGNLTYATIDSATARMNTGVSFNRLLSRQSQATIGYGFGKIETKGATLVDSRTHSAFVTVTHQTTRTLGITGGYRLGRGEHTRIDQDTYYDSHYFNGGLNFTRQITPRRTLGLAGGVGIGYVDSRDRVRQQYWSPTAYASARTDLGRSWTIAVTWDQSVGVLPAPVFSPETFLSQAVVVSAGGFAGSRVQLAFSSGYSTGAAAPSLTGGSQPGSYSSVTGTGQMQILLGRQWSAVMNVNHYHGDLDGVAQDVLRMSQTNRNSVRVGLTGSLPLMGAGRARRVRVRN